MSDSSDSLSRRDFLQTVSAVGLAGLGVSPLLTGCGGGDGSKQPLDCTDASDLSAAKQKRRKTMRKSLKYKSESPKKNKQCANCNLWQKPASGEQCGGCQLIPGPINPNGYCTSWTEKTG
jgi:hypothetical protein